MPLPGDLTTATITGQFTSASGAPVTGSVTFSPTSTLLDPTSQTVFPASGSTYPLSSMGTFQSDPLICTDNVDLEPQGWLYVVRVELQDLQPYSFTTALPSSPSTVDISALEPVSVSIGSAPLTPVASGAYLPSGGGTETGTLVLGGDPPVKIPGAQDGWILVSDPSGNFTAQANTAGSANSIDGVTVSGTVAVGRTIIVTGTGPNTAAWTLPLQVDTSAGDIAPLAASASAGVLTQAAAADHQHPSTGLVDTSSTQSIAGTKTFSGEIIVPAPSAAGDAATKAYVDASAQGLSVKLAVQEATTAALSPGNTYSNGTLGVGATLTATGNGTLTVDGQTVALNDRVLVKNEAAPANHGIYLCTTAGSGGAAYVLTRATDMDQAAEIPGAFAFVINGTANAGDSFAVTGAGPYTVGTTAVNWTLFSAPAQVTAGNSGVTVAGSAVSLAIPVTVAHGGTNAITQQAAINTLAGAVTSGDYLRGDGTNVTMSAISAGDVPTLNQSTTGSAASFTGTLAGDVTGTQGATTVAKIQGTTISTPAGGATSYLDATGHWTTPPGGGGATIDTNPADILPLAASASAGGKGLAADSEHQHPTTGLVTTASLNSGVLTSLEAASGPAVLAGLAGAATSGQYLRGTGSAVALSAIQAIDLPTATTGAQGAVTLDGPLATDIAASPGTAAAGTIGKAADAGHVHGQPPMLAPTGLTGAASASRYVGAVSGAAPATGAFVVGDWVVDKGGTPGFWICTTAGSPGTWSHIVTGTGLTNPMTTLGDTLYGNTPSGGVAPAARLAPGTLGQVLTAKPGSTPPVQWTSGPTDYINVVSQYGADPTGSADATTAIRNALNAAPLGGTVYLPAGTYKVSSPLVVPPTVTLLGSGQSFAYDGGSIAMTISAPVLVPTAAFSTSTAVGGQTVLGVITFVDSSLGGGAGLYASGSSNQAVRNITINGTNITAGTTVYGIAAYGPVWGVRIEDVGIFRMPNYGIFTNVASAGSDTTHFPDVWQLTGVHVAGCHNDGIHMTSIGDTYFTACESTGNSATGGGFANGWTISGDNIKMIGCKAEYNTGIGLSISRGNAARPILVSGFGTDGNGHGGIQITGTGGAGPVVLNGVGLNYDGQNNGAGGNFAALSITGGAHVTATGLHVTTGILGASHLYPQYGVQCPSTFTGVLQIENSEIYGGTAAVNLDTTATGVVRFGPNVLTGSGDWSAQSLANIVHAPSPQTDPQQYAKYWSPSAGTSGNWVTSTAQQPRESIPWYAATGSTLSMTTGQMLLAVIPVMPGDVISKVGFVSGTTAASGPTHWWVALYTTGGTFLGQSADQTSTAIPANTRQLLSLTTAGSGITLPYTVPAGTYALLGGVMVATSTTQPNFRGFGGNAVLMGGSTDLFGGGTQYAALAAGPYTNAAPAPAPTLSTAANLLYLGAC